jgi:hypothetical protein
MLVEATRKYNFCEVKKSQVLRNYHVYDNDLIKTILYILALRYTVENYCTNVN